MDLLSVILPSYNEESNIEPTTKVLTTMLDGANIQFELIYISDGSSDKTYEKITEISQKDSRIKGVQFSRNFGKEAAIFAGLYVACGDACVIMDCDLQHPPEVILEMYKHWKEGYQVVEGVKSKRGKESLFYKLSAGFFYKIMSKLIKMDMNSSSDFKLIDRRVVNVLLELRESNTFFRALTFWVGFRTCTVEYEVQQRKFGVTKWSLSSLMKYAVTNATSFSTLPLQVISFMGMFSLIGSIILGIQTIIMFLLGQAVEGFTTVILLLLIIGGLIMISLGIIGHYIAKIYEEVKGRPKYIISEATNNIKEI